MKKTRNNILIALLPFSLLVAIIAIHGFSYSKMVVCNDTFINCSAFTEAKTLVNDLIEEQPDKTHPRVKAYPYKLYWTTLLSLCVAFGLIALGYSIFVIRKYLFDKGVDRVRYHGYFWSIFGLVAFISWASIDFKPFSDVAPHTWRMLSPHLLKEGFFPDISNIKPYTDGFSIFVSIYVAAAISIILYRILTNNTLAKDELPKYISAFKYLLYLGTILLVVNVLRLHSLLNWSYAFLMPELWPFDAEDIRMQSYHNIEDIIYAIVFIQGLMYSLMLFALYIPSKLIISNTIKNLKDLSESDKDDPQMNEFLENATSFSIGENLTSYLAILGPLLSGPVAELLKNVLAGI